MRSSLLFFMIAGCIVPQELEVTLQRTEDTISQAHRLYAPLCTPAAIARAETGLDFARIELHEGTLQRAEEHLDQAYADAMYALEISTICGGADRDSDTIPDIVDRCPDEPEDLDGDRDEDGCKDYDPTGDDDGDGILNIDDGCMSEPEDFDGHNDHDGCPETSDDSDGDSIVDAIDECPYEPEDLDQFQDGDGCPDLDNDEDGILDLRDVCPYAAEDLDGWYDDDGCPDPDNDEDGIPDSSDACPNEPGVRSEDGCPALDSDGDGVGDDNDRCPNEPETRNDYLDEDGCPDVAPSLVRVTRQRVLPKQNVLFRTGQAIIETTSFGLLDDILQVLQDAPDMRLRIEGHTDSEGGEATNLELSRERAVSVRKYLVQEGIDPDRLIANGFGETRPIDTNRTPRGRSVNRRVEFHIIK